MLSICFFADFQWSEHSSPFWIFHAAVPLVKAASSRNWMGKNMFLSHFAMQSNYLFQWMKPSLKVMIFLQQIDKALHQFFGRARQNCLTPHSFAGSMCLVGDKKKLIACARVRCKRRVDSVAASPRDYLVRRAAKNAISPPKTTPKKQQCKKQECLADKKKLIACARVRCKRRVDSVAASPRDYLVRRAAKNVISPPQNHPKETTMQKSRVSCKWQEEVDSVCQGMVQEKSG